MFLHSLENAFKFFHIRAESKTIVVVVVVVLISLMYPSILPLCGNFALMWTYVALMWKYAALMWKYAALLWNPFFHIRARVFNQRVRVRGFIIFIY